MVHVAWLYGSVQSLAIPYSACGARSPDARWLVAARGALRTVLADALRDSIYELIFCLTYVHYRCPSHRDAKRKAQTLLVFVRCLTLLRLF